MLILYRSLIPTLRVMRIATITLGALTLLSLLFLVKSYFHEDSLPHSPSSSPSSSQYNYSLIGTGPLALKKDRWSALLTFLSHQIVITPEYKRPSPHSLPHPHALSITLKSSGATQTILPEEKIFLTAAPSSLEFSKTPSQLWIIPKVKTAGSLKLEVSIIDEISKEEHHFSFEADLLQEKPQAVGPHCDSLTQSKWWGTDLLFQEYGGEEWRSHSSKQKIYMGTHDPYLLFLEEGDFLIWENFHWKLAAEPPSSADVLIAHVKKIQSQEIELAIWGPGATTPEWVYVHKQPAAAFNSRMDYLPTSFRQRSATQVTCLLGKRRVILSEGDWLLKATSGWRILNNLKDFEDALNHKINGEIFIFDRLEKEGANILLKGSLFNIERTQKQPISISMVSEKKTFKKKRGHSKPNGVSSPS